MIGPAERDNTYAPSPAGGTPLRISVIPNQGGYVYYQTFNQQKFNLYPVISLNETWTASIYVYFPSGGNGFLEIYGTNEFGGIVESNSTFFGAGAAWQRITVSRQFTNVNTKFVQVIFAGGMGGGVPFVASCHFDGLQVEKSSVATTYSDGNTTRATDVLAKTTSKAVAGETSLIPGNILSIDGFTARPYNTNDVNEILYPEDFTNSLWNKSASGTGTIPVVVSNSDYAPDGTLTADKITFSSGGSGNSQIDYGNVVPLSQGQTKTFSVYMRTLSGTTNVTMFHGEDIIVPTVTTTWQRFTFTRTFTGINAYSVRLAKREIWSSGGTADVLVWGAKWENGPGSDYIPLSAGIPGNPNIFGNSENINLSSYWSNSNTIIQNDVEISPANTATADKIIGSAGSTSRKSVYQSASYIPAGTYTYSVYLKSAGFPRAQIWFDTPNVAEGAYRGAGDMINLLTGTVSGVGAVSIINEGDGWYRCYVTATTTVSAYTNFQISIGEANGTGEPAGDGVNGIYVWGAQLTRGSTLLPYERTTADLEIIKDSSGTFNNVTLFGDRQIYNPTNGSYLFNGTNNQASSLTLQTSIPQIFSVSAWMKTSLASGTKIIGYQDVRVGMGSNYDRQIYMGGDGQVKFGIYNGNAEVISSTQLLNDNVWHYVVGTYTSSTGTMTLYVDGTRVSSKTISPTTAQTYQGYWVIGGGSASGWPSGSNGYFTGEIAKADVYNFVLTESQVASYYNTYASRFGRTRTDYARAADAITQKQVAKTGITDTARGTDADPDLTVGKGLTDTARATDAFSRTLTWNRTFTETARGTDTISNNPNKQPSDTARGTDSFSRVVAYSKSYADTARGTDVFSRVVQYSKTYTDTASNADGNSKTFSKTVDSAYGAYQTEFTPIDYNQDLLDLLPNPPERINTPDSIANNPDKRPADTVAASENYIANVSDSINSLASGASGPTALGQISYAGIPSILSAPSVQSGYISFQVLVSGLYTFNITGAAGGVSTTSPPVTGIAPTINGFKRAPGARVVGTISLTAGTIITMVIGQGGGDEGNGWNNPGGGGGTFVTAGTLANIQSGADTLLFAAGGGGGGADFGATDNYSAGIGQAGTSGGTTIDGIGGTSGNGAGLNGAGNSTGGGGYLSNAGTTLTPGFGAAPADGISRGFRQGAVGSRNSGTAIGIGGFGGGGSGSSQTSADQDKGGGGGYSGGGFAFDSIVYGGGGGSYAFGVATAVTITAGGGTTYNGSVSISTTAVVNGFSRVVAYNRSGATYGMTDTARGTDTSLKRDHVQVGGETHYIQNDFTGSTEFVREYLDLIPDGGRTNSTPSGSTTFLLGREIPNTANNYVPFSKDMYGFIETRLATVSASTQISRDLTTELSPVGGIPLLLEGNFDTVGTGIFTTTGVNNLNQIGTIPYMTSRMIPGYIVIPPGQSCNLSVYAKANAPITSGFRFQLNLSTSTGSGNGQGFNTLDTSWQRFSFERSNSSNGPEVHSFDIQVFSGAATGATKLWLDGIQMTFNSGAKPFESSSPNFPTLKMDRVGVGTARALTISKAASGEARTKQREFTPINYTQDLLDILSPDPYTFVPPAPPLVVDTGVRYWVGGTGTWDAANTANWSLSSSGVGGATIPTSATDVVFDGSSGSGTVTLGAAYTPVCKNLTFNAGQSLTTNNRTIECYGSYTSGASSWPVTGLFQVNFLASGGSYNVDMNGKTHSSGAVLYFGNQNGTTPSSATWGLVNNFGSAGSNNNGIYLYAGTFNTNNFNISNSGFSWGGITISGSAAKFMNLGSSVIRLGFNGTGFNYNGSNLTFNAGTSTINVGGSTGFPNSISTSSPLTFNTVVMSTRGTITGSNTFNDLYVSIVSETNGFLTLTANQTVTGLFNVLGSVNTGMVTIQSSISGTQRTITAGTISLQNAYFKDINAAGAAIPWTGDNICDPTTGTPNNTNIYTQVTNGRSIYLDSKPFAYTSGVTWNDLSGNGNNGTLIASPAISTQGGATTFGFNGTSNRVSFTYQIPIQTSGTAFTWNVWVRANRNVDSDMIIGVRGTTLVFSKITTQKFEFYQGEVFQLVTTGQWRMLTGVYNGAGTSGGTNMKWYHNGVSVGLRNGFNPTLNSSPMTFNIGGDNLAGEWYQGYLSLAQVYNRALSDAEITQAYNSHRGRFGL